MQVGLFDSMTLEEDLLSQDASLPIKPRTEGLKTWVKETLKFYNAKAECLSLSRHHSAEVRQNWIDLMLEYAETGLTETPLSLFIQACDYPITNKNLRNVHTTQA